MTCNIWLESYIMTGFNTKFISAHAATCNALHASFNNLLSAQLQKPTLSHGRWYANEIYQKAIIE